jgi:predicted DCC family thiol-disulfide oxidoreductase YuxK
MPNIKSENKYIILFDGVCNFCNYWVNFLIARDKKDKFRFAALQSDTGQALLAKFKLQKFEIDTIILIQGEEYFTKSTAALKITKNIKGGIKILYPFIILPKKIRDIIYDLIAKNRYSLFGKRDVCRVPTEKERKKFLED